jgi:4-azaleucine resistance transporter AzlC
MVSRSSVRAGVRAALPLSIAALAFGLSFGVLARSAGLTAEAAIAMSATTFAGAAQFAAVSVLAAGGGAVAAIAAAALLNARYAPMSLAVAPGLPGRPATRLLTAQLIVDESWALAVRGPGRFDAGVLVGAGLTLYPAWVGGTAIGALGGDVLGDPERLGLDAAFPALFLALLLPLAGTRRAIAAALLGGAIALVLLPVAPAGVPIVASVAACLLGLRR